MLWVISDHPKRCETCGVLLWKLHRQLKRATIDPSDIPSKPKRTCSEMNLTFRKFFQTDDALHVGLVSCTIYVGKEPTLETDQSTFSGEPVNQVFWGLRCGSRSAFQTGPNMCLLRRCVSDVLQIAVADRASLSFQYNIFFRKTKTHSARSLSCELDCLRERCPGMTSRPWSTSMRSMDVARIPYSRLGTLAFTSSWQAEHTRWEPVGAAPSGNAGSCTTSAGSRRARYIEQRSQKMRPQRRQCCI